MTRSNKVISVGVDKMIKIWDSDEFSEENSIISIVGSSPFTSGPVLIPFRSITIISGSLDFDWKMGFRTYLKLILLMKTQIMQRVLVW